MLRSSLTSRLDGQRTTSAVRWRCCRGAAGRPWRRSDGWSQWSHQAAAGRSGSSDCGSQGVLANPWGPAKPLSCERHTRAGVPLPASASDAPNQFGDSRARLGNSSRRRSSEKGVACYSSMRRCPVSQARWCIQAQRG